MNHVWSLCCLLMVKTVIKLTLFIWSWSLCSTVLLSAYTLCLDCLIVSKCWCSLMLNQEAAALWTHLHSWRTCQSCNVDHWINWFDCTTPFFLLLFLQVVDPKPEWWGLKEVSCSWYSVHWSDWLTSEENSCYYCCMFLLNWWSETKMGVSQSGHCPLRGITIIAFLFFVFHLAFIFFCHFVIRHPTSCTAFQWGIWGSYHTQTCTVPQFKY